MEPRAPVRRERSTCCLFRECSGKGNAHIIPFVTDGYERVPAGAQTVTVQWGIAGTPLYPALSAADQQNGQAPHFLIDELITHAIHNETGNGFGAHFRFHVLAYGLHGTWTEKNLFGDLLRGLIFCQQAEDAHFFF